MIKRLPLLLLFILASVFVEAQDLIATSYGDTINAKIIFSTRRYLFFIEKDYSNRHRIRPIKKRRIEAMKVNYFPPDKQETEVHERARSTMAAFGMIQGGFHFSYLPAIVDSTDPASYKKFIRDLKTGYAYNVSLYLRLRPRTLFGIAADNFSTTAYSKELDFYNNQQLVHVSDIRYKINLLYVGPEMMIFRDSKEFRRFFSMSFGIGYAKIKENIRVGFLSDNANTSGGGIRFSATKSWLVTRSLLLGANSKLVYTVFPGSETQSPFALAHIDFGLSVILH